MSAGSRWSCAAGWPEYRRSPVCAAVRQPPCRQAIVRAVDGAGLAIRQEGGAISECMFCDIIAGVVPAHIVLADDEVVAFLDRRPVFKGHVLVAPREHTETLADLPAARVGPYFLRVQRVSAVMPAALGCQGTFVAANNVVSQSVPAPARPCRAPDEGRRAAGILLAAPAVRERGGGRGLRGAAALGAQLSAVTRRQAAVVISAIAPRTSPVMPPRRRSDSTVSACDTASPIAMAAA